MPTPSPLEQLRRELALPVGENAVFDGWTQKAVDSAAAQLGTDPVKARLAMPKSQAGMIDLYIQEVDRALEAYFTPERLAGMKIREKIRALVWRRLEIMGPAREAVRRALAILAMPQNVPLALRIGWRSADLMWRIAGDTSTDFNHYTKRMTLGAVYGSTLLAWLDDKSEGWMDTGAFLDRRIDDVMKFEKWKAEWRGSSEQRLSLSRFLGRLRYPPR
jgi:ubiquinone biosynthesis protein COQ9